MLNRTIYFLSDFGLQDVYVGVVESVLRQQAPGVPVVHLGHEVPAHDVVHGALMLFEAVPFLPDDSVVVAVVDPGVGSSRRAVAVRGERLIWVAPDNGLLDFAFEEDAPRYAVELRHVPPPIVTRASHTFHGRDVFAPAAAKLARGEPMDELGPEIAIDSLQRAPEGLSLSPPESRHGVVLSFDRFGNAITSLRWVRSEVPRGWVEIGSLRVPLRSHYGEVARGEPLALAGSAGLIEVSVRDGSARERLGLKRGVALCWVEGG